MVRWSSATASGEAPSAWGLVDPEEVVYGHEVIGLGMGEVDTDVVEVEALWN
jgi:hypothetical protein